MKVLKTILLLLIGVSIGAIVMWFSSYSTTTPGDPIIKLGDMLSYSRIVISDDNNACEGIVKPSVGDVVASIFEANSLYKRNMMSYGCREDQCVLSVTNCMPWQSTDCGSRMLVFKINTQKEIETSSFRCIDMP